MTERLTETQPVPERFTRTQRLLGPEAVRKLMAARITVVGLGAVGSYATEALARGGAGHLRLVDFDVVRESNINRQLYALTSTLGRPKAEVALDRVKDINPQCEVDTRIVFFDRQTAPDILAARPDVVVDAIDSTGPKLDLIAAAVANGIPIVSSMGAATRIDPFAIRVGDISETRHCPLARYLRKHLKHRGISTGVRCVYSIELARKRGHGSNTAQTDGEISPEGEPQEADEYVRGRARSPLGSVSYLTGMFGLIVAKEAMDIVLNGTAI